MYLSLFLASKFAEYVKNILLRRFPVATPKKLKNPPLETVKCVVVGDRAVGKTCLLISYTNNGFPTEDVPTVFDNYVSNVTEGEVSIDLALYDTGDDYSLRSLTYPETNVFIICYSIASRASYENVKSRWEPEISECVADDACYLLVATKVDLRDGEEANTTLLTREDGFQLADDIGASQFFECSALTQKGLSEMFVSAVAVALRSKVVARRPTATFSAPVQRPRRRWGQLLRERCRIL